MAGLEKYMTLDVWAEMTPFCCLACGFNRRMNADSSTLKLCCGKCSSLGSDLSHLAVALSAVGISSCCILDSCSRRKNCYILNQSVLLYCSESRTVVIQ